MHLGRDEPLCLGCCPYPARMRICSFFFVRCSIPMVCKNKDETRNDFTMNARLAGVFTNVSILRRTEGVAPPGCRHRWQIMKGVLQDD